MTGQSNGDDSDSLAIRYGTLKAFIVEHRIGQGVSSEVHQARCRSDGRLVALKRVRVLEIADQKTRSSCLKEIDLLKQLSHENIIRCFASFMEDDQLHIVLELASAGDLSRLIRHHKRKLRLMDEATIWKYFVQIIRAVDHMHSKRIMHRDIKPANVFIRPDGMVKLGDLGLGRFFSARTMAAHSTVGTPYYMSPEIISVQHGHTFKSDIWSSGCLLYEMAALQSPFFCEKTNVFALIKKIEICKYPPLPGNVFSMTMRNLIVNCICSDVEKRPDTKKVLEIAEEMYHHSTPPEVEMRGDQQQSVGDRLDMVKNGLEQVARSIAEGMTRAFDDLSVIKGSLESNDRNRFNGTMEDGRNLAEHAESKLSKVQKLGAELKTQLVHFFDELKEQKSSVDPRQKLLGESDEW